MRVLDVDDDTEFLEQQVSEDMRSSKQMMYDFVGVVKTLQKLSPLEFPEGSGRSDFGVKLRFDAT